MTYRCFVCDTPAAQGHHADCMMQTNKKPGCEFPRCDWYDSDGCQCHCRVEEPKINIASGEDVMMA